MKDHHILAAAEPGLQEVLRHKKGEVQLEKLSIEVPVVNPKKVNVTAVRAAAKMEREDFASLLGMSVEELKVLEEGSKEPAEKLASLLMLMQADPPAVIKQINAMKEIAQADERIDAANESRGPGH